MAVGFHFGVRNVLWKSAAVVAAQLCEYTKSHWNG